MKVKLLAVALIIILAAGVWWGLDAVNTAKTKQAAQINQAAQTNQAANLTGSNSSASSALQAANSGTAPLLDAQGGVEVAVTWEKGSSGSSKLVFSVEMNNHMISLDDYDFSKNTEFKLKDATVPVKVEVLQKSGEGHHVSAKIGVQGNELNNLKAGSRFTLILKNLAGVPVRNFAWTY